MGSNKNSLINCLSFLMEIMVDGSYFFFNKDSKDLVINDEVYSIIDDAVIKIPNETPRFVFNNAGFKTIDSAYYQIFI